MASIHLVQPTGDQIQRLLINEFPNFLHSTKLPFLTILSEIHQTIWAGPHSLIWRVVSVGLRVFGNLIFYCTATSLSAAMHHGLLNIWQVPIIWQEPQSAVCLEFLPSQLEMTVVHQMIILISLWCIGTQSLLENLVKNNSNQTLRLRWRCNSVYEFIWTWLPQELPSRVCSIIVNN